MAGKVGENVPRDNYEWFAKQVFKMRDDLRDGLGADYSRTIQPIMDNLRETAKRLNISVLKAFERVSIPLLDRKHALELWLLGAAVAELYLLRESLFPGVKRG